jgi:hypothetical protein
MCHRRAATHRITTVDGFSLWYVSRYVLAHVQRRHPEHTRAATVAYQQVVGHAPPAAEVGAAAKPTVGVVTAPAAPANMEQQVNLRVSQVLALL